MTNKIHNLDDGVQEYFEFIVKGHTYRFKQPNTEELDDMRTATTPGDVELDDKAREAEEKESKEALFQFITSVGEAPEFKEISKKMTVPHWNRFNKMVAVEMGLDADNQSPAGS